MELLDFSLIQWCVAGLCAFMIGFAKMGISGAGFLVVPLLASVMDSRESTGFLLPILSLADIMAIIWWRNHVDYTQITRLFIPWTLTGVISGFFILKVISSSQLMPVIGILTIILLFISRWLNHHSQAQDIHLPSNPAFAGTMGILAGATSMLANAAGAIMTIYLLATKFDKKRFIGTSAMFFFLLNLTKIPFSMKLNLVTLPSFLTNLTLMPAILCGSACGIWLVNKIDQKKFNVLVMILALISSIFLCFKPLWLNKS